MHPGRTAHAGRRGTAMKKRIVTLANFGWGIAHEAVTRLLPIRLDTMVPRTHMYTYAANVWDSSIVTIRNFCIAVGRTSPASWSSSTASNAARWSDMCCFMNASSSSLSCAAPPPHPLSPAVQRYAKGANRHVRDFGWEIAHGAVTPRPPISFDTMVPRTEGYARDVGVWDLSIVQGPFSVAPCQTLAS
jgi:hypothetical protein